VLGSKVKSSRLKAEMAKVQGSRFRKTHFQATRLRSYLGSLVYLSSLGQEIMGLAKTKTIISHPPAALTRARREHREKHHEVIRRLRRLMGLWERSKVKGKKL
jgi:hypothetical protein